MTMFDIATNDMTKAVNSIALRQRRLAVSQHPKQMGIDYINVRKQNGDYRLLLHFIPASSETPDKVVIPEVTPEKIRITDGKDSKALSDILIKDVFQGEWERRIEPVIDTAFRFDGKTKIICGQEIDLTNQSFTIEFWAKRSSIGSHHMVIGQGPELKNSALKIGFQASNHFIFGFNGDDLQTEKAYTDTNWHHWACVYDAAPQRQFIYRDGQKVADRVANNHYQGTGYFYIGDSSHDGFFFNANVEESPSNVRIWNRARTEFGEKYCFDGAIADVRLWHTVKKEDEILEHMYHTLTGQEEKLAAYWTSCTNSTAVDHTGNNHQGKCPENLNLVMEQPPAPPGYIARRKGNRVDLYKTGNSLTIIMHRDEKMAQDREVFQYQLELPGVMNLDPFFSKITFTLDQESEFDPQPLPSPKIETGKAPEIDYLTKDYQSFRNLMLDRMSALAPKWTERNPGDMTIAITEILAYAADHLSYFQDAVSTEAYLGTARHRVSVARHARLIDYFMHEGCNARTWVHFHVEGDTQLAPRTPLTTVLDSEPTCISPDRDPAELLQAGGIFFETMHPAQLLSKHNQFRFYTWGGYISVLEQGATQTTLQGSFPDLHPGDILIFEEQKGEETGLVEDANPNHRHAVRLTKVEISSDPLGGLEGNPMEITKIQWMEEDALPFTLRLNNMVAGKEIQDISVALGNIVLVEHGISILGEPLPSVPSFGKYRPELRHTNLTYSVPYDYTATQKWSASKTLEQNPRDALAPVRLIEANHQEEWTAQTDFFDSDRFTKGFVVEIENDRRAFLRFGSGKQGKQPLVGTQFQAEYRIGNGIEGNIGRDAIAHVITYQQAITMVRNPLPAYGGCDPEGMEEVRLLAPRAFQSQERCVTPDDYVAKIESHPEVQRAVATIRWTGAWHTVFITVERLGNSPVNEKFCQRLRSFMEQFRIVGTDIRIEPPRFVPLDIEITVSLLPGYFPSTVEKTLNEQFSNMELPDGQLGFFHPDRFTFGQSVYLSQLITKVHDIPGVNQIQVTKFQRWGSPPRDELEKGVLIIEPEEIIRLDNNIATPANGRITFVLNE